MWILYRIISEIMGSLNVHSLDFQIRTFYIIFYASSDLNKWIFSEDCRPTERESCQSRLILHF